MPEFKAGRNAAELLRQHKQIHEGMEKLEAYLESVRSGERELELSVMKERMEVGGWGEVLWTHLDHEVKTLGAENMRKYCEFFSPFGIAGLGQIVLRGWNLDLKRADAIECCVFKFIGC